jgi:hypothetical protein
MTTPFYSFILSPVLGWLTLLSLLTVGYLGRLEFLERRRNRQLDEKRARLRHGEPLKAKTPRRLAMREMAELPSMESNVTRPLARFQNVDRQAGWDFTPAGLN